MQSLIKRFSTQSVATRHVLAALVVNQPGCLSQIANLFAARGIMNRSSTLNVKITLLLQDTTSIVWWLVEQKYLNYHV